MYTIRRKRSRANKVQVNDVCQGVVVRVEDQGAYINVQPGRDGFIHLSQVSETPPKKIGDVLKEGESVKVRVLEIDRQGRIRLTMLSLDDEPAPRKRRESSSRRKG